MSYLRAFFPGLKVFKEDRPLEPRKRKLSKRIKRKRKGKGKRKRK
jgi:hypothetical protein